MEEDSVVRLPRPGSSVVDDPLLAVLRDGARRMLQQVIEAEVEAFLAAHAELEDERGRRRVVRNGHAPEREIQTGIGPIAVRRPKVRDRGDGAGGARSASPRRCCRRSCGGPGTSRSCCPGSTSRASRPASSRRRLAALLGPTRPVSRRRPCAAWWRPGRRSTSAGSVVISRPGATSTSGPTASTSRRGSTTIGSAFSSSSAPMPMAARSCWRSRTAFARAPRAGASCCLRLRDENGLRAATPSSPPATAPWASGRPCTRSGRTPGSSAAGSTRPPTFSTSCPSRCTARRRRTCTRSTRPRAGPPPRTPSTASSPSTAPSTTRRQRAWPRIARPCSRSTTSRPSTGSTCAPRIPIESTFATVRLRTDKTKGCLSRETALAMVFKLAKSAERHWRQLDGANRLGQVIEGIRFRDGEPVQDAEEQAAA